jgi:beta-N-acetylhexosaminidase
MSDLTRLAASVLLPGFRGTTLPGWLAAWLERGLAGVCLFGQNVADPAQVRRLTHAVHAAGSDALVASDEEGGTVTRLEAQNGSSWPGHAALGALEDPEATRQVAAGIAAQCRAAGIDLNAAPVVDVNSEPDNPVIGVRSFGAEPDLVARHGAAFVAGLQDGGVAACPKHFPGHGATRTDSHVTLPVLDADADLLRRRDLPPFAAAVDAGARAVMTAHVVVRGVDAEPATMSPTLLALLREELGFSGVVVSDALDMRAISQGVGRATGAVRALAAGVDLLCVGNPEFPDPYDEEPVVEELVAAIVSAVETGVLSRERLEDASARVAALGAWCARQREGQDAGAATGDAAGAPDTWPETTTGARIAARALRVRGDVRVRGEAVVCSVGTAVGFAAGRREWTLVRLLQQLRPDWCFRTLPEPPKDPGDPAGPAAQASNVPVQGRPLLVLVEGRLDDRGSRLLRALLVARPDAVIVYGALPQHDDPGANTVHTFGGGAASAQAVVELILGEDR